MLYFCDKIGLKNDFQNLKSQKNYQNENHLENNYNPSVAKSDKFFQHLNLKRMHPLLFEKKLKL